MNMEAMNPPLRLFHWLRGLCSSLASWSACMKRFERHRERIKVEIRRIEHNRKNEGVVLVAYHCRDFGEVCFRQEWSVQGKWCL